MRTTYLIATTVIGLALAAPLAAHHNSPFYEDLEIGDMMGRHEDAIDNLNLSGPMDPSNEAPVDSSGSMPTDIDPQPNGTGIPDGSNQGLDNGGITNGRAWPE